MPKGALFAIPILLLALGGVGITRGAGRNSAWYGLSVGLGLGAIVGYAIGARHRGVVPTSSVLPLCTACGQRVPRGVARCPYCHPTVPPETRFERTVMRDHDAEDAMRSLPGLAQAAALMQEVGAPGLLYLIEGPQRGQVILLAKASIFIGRGEDNHVVIDDEAVSQRHAQVRPHADAYEVLDLDSRNGTFLNDDRVTRAKLRTGDVLAFGDTRLYVQLAAHS